MTESEITTEILKLGFSIIHSYEVFPGEWIIRAESGKTTVSFLIPFEKGLVNKQISFYKDAEKGNGIDEVLEKHREKYLSLLGMEFEEERIDTVSDTYRAIFFRNISYSGQVHINLIEGIESVTYGLSGYEQAQLFQNVK